jgi:hypothetical protein
MIIIHAILVIIFLFGSGFAQSDTAKSSKSLQAEVTVEIQYDGEVGSGIILMTGNPVSCTTSITASQGVMSILTSLATNTPFNTPPVYGSTRSQMINATSTGQYLFQTATGTSQIMTGVTTTQNPSDSSSQTVHASPVTGSGMRLDPWSHVFFWAAVIEIISSFI